jgi:hypothetical protein
MPRARRRNAYMTAPQIAAAYKLYAEGGWSLNRLAAALWQRYGYASQSACLGGLYGSFKRAGYEVRTRVEGQRVAALREGA